MDYNLSATIAYGPAGGGTTRAGFTSENGRVHFVSKEPAGEAEYDEIWFDWADGQLQDNGDGTYGDGMPDNEQPIDIDGDGVLDLVKDDGVGGPLGPGVYRAVATDKIVTFH